ncbi:unnamed protein product [Allacma fusca]|uniref:Uncharacterized protein n=1 Tax=Allacma fusca TaxID=39272 RepID=A0A8J2KJK6_9HEXA|nr:unnamed protein product [Allacma fusca]
MNTLQELRSVTERIIYLSYSKHCPANIIIYLLYRCVIVSTKHLILLSPVACSFSIQMDTVQIMTNIST